MNKATNWDRYYEKPFATSTLTRRITTSKLISVIKRYTTNIKNGVKIIELGGANSCFYDALNKAFEPKLYSVLDNNIVGLDKFLQRVGNSEATKIINVDVLSENILKEENYDVVFSVGLIEHFSKENTKKAIRTHFDYLKDGGICIITFPTPTFLYKFVRKFLEIINVWIFHDERPLLFDEVISECEKHGEILHKSINWLTILTQGIIVMKKKI